MDHGFKMCPHCQRPAALQAAVCPRCGLPYFAAPVAPAAMPHPFTPPQAAAFSSAGAFTMIQAPQEELRGGFNLGAFAFGWLWGAFHRAYWTFLPFGILAVYFCFAIPVVISSEGQAAPPPLLYGLVIIHGLVQLGIAVWFGFRGNEWAWKSGRFRTAQECRAAQKGWNIAGGILLASSALIGFIAGLVGAVLIAAPANRYPLPTTTPLPTSIAPGPHEWGAQRAAPFVPAQVTREPMIRIVPIPTMRVEAPRAIHVPTEPIYVPAPPVFMGRPTTTPAPWYRPPFSQAPAFREPMNRPLQPGPQPPPVLATPRIEIQPGTPVPAITTLPRSAQAQRV